MNSFIIFVKFFCLGFIGPLVVLGLFVFRPIVYKPLWHTFVFRFELYENLSFLSSLEVLLRTTDPYLWIPDSEWRIFLTYLGTSSKWREFLPFWKPLNRRPPFPPIRSRVHTHFRSRWISPQIWDNPSPSGNQSSVNCSFESDFRYSRVCLQSCSWCTRLFAVLVRSSMSLFFVLFSLSITCASCL